jgi:hypothetical protein
MPDRVTNRDNPLRRLLQALARCDDPLVAGWAKELVEHGQSASVPVETSPKPAGRKAESAITKVS